ncbi:MAG: polymerase sigma factor CnrH [Gammaproteobacteria bacterium]|jgi:RNA polymerase sigma factor (sigma-70 family)|nr:polymerase sigma factor CnrH [Gammaproteobacteria bacterium]
MLMTVVTDESDGALAAQALQGDDAAFALLVSRHKGWAYQFVRRYVGNSADAYDVLQDTFFSAWRALGRYERDRPFEFWLRRIALNKCRDRNRRETVRRLIGARSGAEESEEIQDPAPGPSALTEGDQELRLLERYIAKLPRSLMEPLLLTALEGLSQEEAGKLLGISAKAIETKVYRARMRLTAVFGPRGVAC